MFAKLLEKLIVELNATKKIIRWNKNQNLDYL